LEKSTIKLGNNTLELKLTEATEPTNIIWENRYVDRLTLIKRVILFAVVVSVLFAFTFGCTFYLKAQAEKASDKYTQSTCGTLSDEYTDA